jgi:CHAT domain-containing protein
MTHPTAETLAAFAAGGVDAQTREDVLAHLQTCNACMTEVQAATEFLRSDQTRSRSQSSYWWLAAAAAIAVFVAVPLLLRHRSDPVARLASLAPRTERILEPRLTGGFAWAPYHGPLRANDAGQNLERLKLGGAAGEVIERAQRDSSNDAQRAGAIALVLIDRPSDAADKLRAVAEKSPNDARVWSDLAAARYAVAIQLKRPSLLPEALAASDRALRIDSRSAEALFNRALILDRLGLSREARAAWERFLAVDSTSAWATEARQRLSKLPQQTRELLFQKELPRIERAALANDAATVKSIVARFPQQARQAAEAETLGQWGERHDDRPLIVARAIGAALAGISGESLLRDAVAAIDRADPVRRAVLAEAHVHYRRGRMAYARQQFEEGERELRDAASRFGDSPMAFPARYYAASARFDRHDVAAACAEQAALRDELPPRDIAMRAQVPWALALCRMVDNDWSGALPLLAESENGFHALGERSNLGFILALTASAYTYMGRADDAWAARIRGFEALSGEGRGDRLNVGLGAAARSELREGRLEAALAMMQLEESADRAVANDGELVDALMRQAVLQTTLGDDVAGASKARQAESAARAIRDPALRARAVADAAFANGAAALRRDPRRARQLLTAAIDAYRGQGVPAMLPELYLLRARASIQLHDPSTAVADLDDGIKAAGVANEGVLDAGNALYDEAVRLQLALGDVAKAFSYADRATVSDVAALQQRLANSGTTVVELVTLPSEVIAFSVSERGVTVARTTTAGDDLYARLIAPLKLDARQLIVVPGRHFEGVPFAALFDRRTKRYLVEQTPVSIAISATSLQRAGTRAPQSVLAVALPTGAALPESERETSDVRALYRQSSSIAPTFAAFAKALKADVVHIAGHTEREPGAGDAALLFADERVSWKRIAHEPMFDGGTIVLAACETLRAPRDPQTRALSLGGAFLAAGAESVIGTLTPIADRDARDLFGAIHRGLAAGASPAEAVRGAQMAAIARGETAWQSIAILTRTIQTERTEEARHGRDHGLLRGNLHASAGGR